MEHIPPTQESLLQHVNRVAYQSGIWATSELAQQLTPNPEGWGWTLDGDAQVLLLVWGILPMASRVLHELIKCGCKSGCGVRCSCKKAHWNCTLSALSLQLYMWRNLNILCLRKWRIKFSSIHACYSVYIYMTYCRNKHVYLDLQINNSLSQKMYILTPGLIF